MPKQLDPRQTEILQQFHPNPKAAVWDCHGTLVIYHKAIEIIAANAGITFDPPQVIVADPEKKNVAILVTGRLGDKAEWSIGEAAPYNNKNGYPFAMSEKRAKDRVVLKLLNLHGDIYSEDEADDFRDDARSRPSYSDLVKEMKTAQDPKSLRRWGADNAERIAKMSEEDVENFTNAYRTYRESLGEAA